MPCPWRLATRLSAKHTTPVGQQVVQAYRPLRMTHTPPEASQTMQAEAQLHPPGTGAESRLLLLDRHQQQPMIGQNTTQQAGVPPTPLLKQVLGSRRELASPEQLQMLLLLVSHLLTTVRM